MLELWLCLSENHRWTQMDTDGKGLPAGSAGSAFWEYGVIFAALREGVDVAEGVANAD